MGARKTIRSSAPELFAACAISAFLLFSSSGCLLFATSNDDASADAGSPDGGALRDGGGLLDDAGVEDAGAVDDAGNLEDGGTDAGFDGGDAGVDSGVSDSGVFDSGVFDSGVFDDAGVDSGVVDDAGVDGGVVDDDAGPDGGVDCDLLFSEDAFPPQCVGAFAVYSATPAVLSTTTDATLYVHGNFPTEADISLQPVGAGSLFALTRAERSVAAFTIEASTSFQGLARIVDGNAATLGIVLVDLRPHVVTLGAFGNELPQTGAAKKIGQAAVGGVLTNVRPYRVGKNLVCGVGGDGSGEVTCMRTDIDGSVREPRHGAPGDPARAFLPQPRSETATAIVNRRLFVLGGEIGGRPSSLVHSVGIDTDGKTQAARAEPSLKTPRHNATAIQVRDLLCVFGGSDDDDNSLSSVECARIRVGGLGAFQFAGNLANARSGAAVAVLDDVIVIVGGGAGNNSVATVEFAPIAAVPFVFLQGPNVPSAGSNAASVVLDDKLYVLGGRSELVVDLGSTGVIQLSFSNGGALQATTGVLSMHAALYKFGAVVVGNFVYATPGRIEGGFTGAAVAHIVPINAAKAIETRVDNAATFNELAFSSSALVDDSLFIFGGRLREDFGVSESTIRRIQFGPEGGIASDVNVSPMPEARSHSCAVLLDDRVFIIGGSAETLSTATTSVMVGTYNESLQHFDSFFTVAAGLSASANGPRCVVNGDDVYVLGGRLPDEPEAGFSIQHASVASLLAVNAGSPSLFSRVVLANAEPQVWMASTKARGNGAVSLYGGIYVDGDTASAAVLTLDLNTVPITITTSSAGAYASANMVPFAFGAMQIGGGAGVNPTSDDGRFFVDGNFNVELHQDIIAIPRRGQVSVLVGPYIHTFGGRNNAAPIERVLATTLIGGDP